MKRFWLFLLLIAPFLSLSAAEFKEGLIKLVLHENTGRFSLYLQNNHSGYDPLFIDQDPRTSFVSIMLNDRAFKLGDTSTFRTRPGADPDRPLFIFESAQLLVTQEFNFIKTAGSDVVNGIEIKITLTSRAPASIYAGFRLLLDTFLGEPGSFPHFLIENKPVNNEILLAQSSSNFWISRNNNISLMGSIFLPGGYEPDSVHFANWKRLTDVSWKAPFDAARNFNAPPYSIGDSAVCYYFEPRMLRRNESFSAVILLAQEDARGFNFRQAALIAEAPVYPFAPVETPVQPARFPETPVQPAPQPVPQPAAQTQPAPQPIPQPAPSIEPVSQITQFPLAQMERDYALIRDIINRIDYYLETDEISEDELAIMEQTLERLLSRYGLGSGNFR